MYHWELNTLFMHKIFPLFGFHIHIQQEKWQENKRNKTEIKHTKLVNLFIVHSQSYKLKFN